MQMLDLLFHRGLTELSGEEEARKLGCLWVRLGIDVDYDSLQYLTNVSTTDEEERINELKKEIREEDDLMDIRPTKKKGKGKGKENKPTKIMRKSNSEDIQENLLGENKGTKNQPNEITEDNNNNMEIDEIILEEVTSDDSKKMDDGKSDNEAMDNISEGK